MAQFGLKIFNIIRLHESNVHVVPLPTQKMLLHCVHWMQCFAGRSFRTSCMSSKTSVSSLSGKFCSAERPISFLLLAILCHNKIHCGSFQGKALKVLAFSLKLENFKYKTSILLYMKVFFHVFHLQNSPTLINVQPFF